MAEVKRLAFPPRLRHMDPEGFGEVSRQRLHQGGSAGQTGQKNQGRTISVQPIIGTITGQRETACFTAFPDRNWKIVQ
jgi:hypothetical protein